MIFIFNKKFKKLFIFGLILLIILGVIKFISLKNEKPLPVANFQFEIEEQLSRKELIDSLSSALKLNVKSSKRFFKHALPILGSNQQQKSLFYLLKQPTDLINLTSEFLIGIKVSDPISILSAALGPQSALSNDSPTKVVNSDLFPNLPKKRKSSSFDKKRQAQKPELRFSQTEQSDKIQAFYNKTLVGVYHTHTSESYGVSVFNGHSAPGTKGDIAIVGRELVQKLNNKYGVQAIQSTKVNDAVYRESYIRSRNVAQKMVKQNPNLEMIFDIHRDALAIKDKNVITTTINGQEVAKVMIVVAKATPSYGLSHPNWRRNLAFANRLANKMNRVYPGLLRKVKVIDNRRYNQDLHPHALLLEFGGVSNTLPEVKRSARLMANVIASLLADKISD